MQTLTAKDFSLKHTVESGQIFRWDFINGWYFVSSGDEIAKVRQENNKLIYDSSPGFNIKKFFFIEENYKSILKKINKDEALNKAIKRYRGLRIIKQEPWECTISFIASSYSNIPKIKKSINALCMCFGKEINLNGYKLYSFPQPKDLNDFKMINRCSLGFRAKYIHDAAKIISSKTYFKKIKDLSYAEAKKELMKLPGVGEKVADCILLFSLQHYEAFPVDVWIKRVMEKAYFHGKETPNKRIASFAQNYFGKYAGYAQQFLYHYARLNNEK